MEAEEDDDDDEARNDVVALLGRKEVFTTQSTGSKESVGRRVTMSQEKLASQ